MSRYDSLGDRMKGYESASFNNLLRRTPVIVQVDGKAFHTYTRCIKDEPFHDGLHEAMSFTARRLMRNIQNAVFAYVQSDEISILLKDWKTLTTDAWFSNRQGKVESVSASIATAYFNEYVRLDDGDGMAVFSDKGPALFDARAFNLPMEEVCNYFIWRQQDATRNSIQSLGQHHFSHKELQKLSCNQVQEKLLLDRDVNWNDLSIWKKRGFSLYNHAPGTITDYENPIFTQEREYIEKHLQVEEK